MPRKPKRAAPFPAPVDALVTPRFAGISTFLRLPQITNLAELDVAIVGIPFDGGTSYRAGARHGPRQVRDQSALIRPYNPALGVNPFIRKRTADYGDLPVNPLSIDDSFRRIETGIRTLLEAGVIPLSVGGDHSILLPILRAIHATHGPVGLIQLDAHSDTWDQYWGMKYSHGTPVRRAIEEGLLAEGLVLQVGLRGQLYAEDDLDYARANGIVMVTAEEFHAKGVAGLKKQLARFRDKSTYLSLDIDVVDPAFAPGTGTPQVGGLSSAQILALVRGLAGLRLVGADVVEVSPPFDSAGITSLLAANLLHEILCIL